MPKKGEALILDYSITEYCNLACGYCRDKPIIADKTSLNEHFILINTGLKRTLEHLNPAVIKISGYGEITLYDRFPELFNLAANTNWQIITNGTLLNGPTLSGLAEYDGLSICYSLDGHTLALNGARGYSEKLLDKVLTNIDYSIKFDMPVEINSVLTKHNIEGFPDFLEYMSQYHYGNVMIFPFAVRPFPGKDNQDLSPTDEQIEEFGNSMNENIKRFANHLPPKAYLEELVTFLQTGQRRTACNVPLVNVGVDPEGDIKLCPCGPDENLGNIYKDSVSKLREFPFRKKGVWKECIDCFNHYEVISQYLNGWISLDEITKVPSLNNQKAKKFLSRFKK